VSIRSGRPLFRTWSLSIRSEHSSYPTTSGTPVTYPCLPVRCLGPILIGGFRFLKVPCRPRRVRSLCPNVSALFCPPLCAHSARSLPVFRVDQWFPFRSDCAPRAHAHARLSVCDTTSMCSLWNTWGERQFFSELVLSTVADCRCSRVFNEHALYPTTVQPCAICARTTALSAPGQLRYLRPEKTRLRGVTFGAEADYAVNARSRSSPAAPTPSTSSSSSSLAPRRSAAVR